MFDTLLASHTIAAPWTRAVMSAVLLHVVLIVAAVSSTASPDPGTRPVARDTIRLAITEEATSSPPKSAEPLRSRPEAVIPEAPRVPDIDLNAPEFQAPRLSFSPLGRPESSPTSLHRTFGESPVARDSSRSVLGTTEVDELPELAEELHPRYPDKLRRAGVSGLVQVQYVVGSDGRVDERTIRVLASSHQAFLAGGIAGTPRQPFQAGTPRRAAGGVLVQQAIRFRYR